MNSKKIVVLPIEPLQERYSAQWLRWTQNQLKRLREEENFYYKVLLPDTEHNDYIRDGEFLDVFGTNMFKMNQIQMAIDWIDKNREQAASPNTVFWVHDGWYPGIETLAYIRNAMGYKFKIACCLHAGTWDKNDFITRVGMKPWASSLESSWMNIYDYIFVATRYHRDLLVKSGRIKDTSKIYITGFPIKSETPKVGKKSKLVVFPHRLAQEKGPQLFDELMHVAIATAFKDFSFIRTQEVLAKEERQDRKTKYYQLLMDATYSVSFALQETWGIAMQESVFADCIPIVPDTLSYKEMYPDFFKYYTEVLYPEVAALDTMIKVSKDFDFAKELLDKTKKKFKAVGEKAIPNMVNVMLGNSKIDDFKTSPYEV